MVQALKQSVLMSMVQALKQSRSESVFRPPILDPFFDEMMVKIAYTNLTYRS
jgi:hypothetical protein